MITKFKLFENDEYSIVEKYNLNELCSHYYDADYESFDSPGFKRKLNKLFLNNLCEFGEDYGPVEDKINIIKGIITDIDIENQFDEYIILRFKVNDKLHEVDWTTNVKVYLKEPRKIKEYDKTLDPYGEEEWDD